jgi:hypothetical protein
MRVPIKLRTKHFIHINPALLKCTEQHKIGPTAAKLKSEFVNEKCMRACAVQPMVA